MQSGRNTWHELGPSVGENDISRLEIYDLLKRVV